MSDRSDSFQNFFEQVTGFTPYGYQRRLAERPGWPDLMDVPTGLGKTAAVVVAWLWKRLQGDEHTGRRLVYCLPMRTLVEQTHNAAVLWCRAAAPFFKKRGLVPAAASLLMGGATEAEWDTRPSEPHVIVGTQDMLLSRALFRGYGMSRYRWPMHFGFLNSDCLWVFDETQLMGVGVETGAQMQAFREALGTLGSARSLWMSATLGRAQLETVDHPEPDDGWQVHMLSPREREQEAAVRERVLARKHLSRADGLLLASEPDDAYYRRVAEAVATAAKDRGGLTLVIVNRVVRAQQIFRAVREALADDDLPCGLLHSRFRRPDRERNRSLLDAPGDRVVISTQVVEAGVDISARTLFTELAPWPSLVQRFGRCNRYGEAEREGYTAEIHWIPVATGGDEGLALPYDAAELERAETLLGQLQQEGADAGPRSLEALSYEAPPVIRPVIRRRDLLDLFDTSSDLLGYDLDVSRFVRDTDDCDVLFFWRDFDLGSGVPPVELSAPVPHELCSVSVKQAMSFLEALERARRRLLSGGKAARARANLLRAWRWDSVGESWSAIRPRQRVRPGEFVLLHVAAEGYDPDLGWTGEVTGKANVPEIPEGADLHGDPPASMSSDEGTYIRRWILLQDHLAHVEAAAERLAEELSIEPRLADIVTTAARWHDVGKAHPQFQRRLLQPLEDRAQADGSSGKHPGPGPWAKSNHRLPATGVRPYFRHELASALAWLAHCPDAEPRYRDLVAFLVAAHHGKVRLTLRSVPGEQEPEAPETPYACGVWHGDILPPVALPDGHELPETRLDLSLMHLGDGSWTDRMAALRDDPELGVFRLAYLEGLLRAADERASSSEARAVDVSVQGAADV